MSNISDISKLQFHASDLISAYDGADHSDYIVYFANHLDPNGGASVYWPKYDTETKQLLELGGSMYNPQVSVTMDTYRTEQMDFGNELHSRYGM